MKDALISKKEVLEKLVYLKPFRKSDDIFDDIYSVINSMKSRGEIAVDVGYWWPVPSADSCWRCSKCGHAVEAMEYFCPKCGDRNYPKEVYDKLRREEKING